MLTSKQEDIFISSEEPYIKADLFTLSSLFTFFKIWFLQKYGLFVTVNRIFLVPELACHLFWNIFTYWNTRSLLKRTTPVILTIINIERADVYEIWHHLDRLFGVRRHEQWTCQILNFNYIVLSKLRVNFVKWASVQARWQLLNPKILCTLLDFLNVLYKCACSLPVQYDVCRHER